MCGVRGRLSAAAGDNQTMLLGNMWNGMESASILLRVLKLLSLTRGHSDSKEAQAAQLRPAPITTPQVPPMQPLLLLHNRAAGAALALRQTTRLGLSPAATASRGRPMDSTSRQIHTERVLQADGTDSGVRVMHLNKPDTLNSLTVTMAGDFEAALQQLGEDTAARALIITGRAISCQTQKRAQVFNLASPRCTSVA